MDPEKLRSLQIKPEAKTRPQRSIWIIFAGIILLTGVFAYYAWPKKGDERRLFGGDKLKSITRQGPNATPTTNRPPARTNGSLLTVSGYIVTRERVELSPRFLGTVKWIGVQKGDRVTNGQVVVLLDD